MPVVLIQNDNRGCATNVLLVSGAAQLSAVRRAWVDHVNVGVDQTWDYRPPTKSMPGYWKLGARGPLWLAPNIAHTVVLPQRSAGQTSILLYCRKPIDYFVLKPNYLISRA